MLNSYINAEDQLSVLRPKDRFRNWHSFDDKRLSILCGRTFTGRQVQICTRRGKSFLTYSRDNCNSIPQHWVHPENPLVFDKVFQDSSFALGFLKKTTVARMAAQS